MHPDSLPLRGVFVADFSRILAGPLCTMMLGDAGARVVKVEEPQRGDETRRWGPPFVGGESAYYLSVNRNKESIGLNLKDEAALEVARRLIERADVVIENFLPEQREHFGFTFDRVKSLNPRVVLCSISGFDRESAESALPGYDLLAQASAGLMSITGPPEGEPTKVGVALADVLSAHHAHGAILAALLRRERTGEGAFVEISLQSSTVASLINVAQSYLVTRQVPRRYGNEHPSIVPYQAFHASDRWLVVAVASDQHFEMLCRKVIDREDLADDPRFRTNAQRVENRIPLVAELKKVFESRHASEWVSRCREAGIPAAMVESLDTIFANAPHLVKRIEHPSARELDVVTSAFRIDEERYPTRMAPPLLGEQSGAILRELGFSEEEIVALRERGATSAHP